MKAGLPLLALALLAACVPATKAPPAPVAAPTPVVRPTPAPARPAPLPASADANWADALLTPGAWRYTDYGQGMGKRSLFSDPDDTFYFSLSCVTQPNGPEILLARTGRPQKPTLAMTIRTETMERTLSAQQGTPAMIAIAVPAADPLLDAMALSKGRFAVEVEGEATLILPSHAEVSRVIEDCR
jgi:hypothetical protein